MGKGYVDVFKEPHDAHLQVDQPSLNNPNYHDPSSSRINFNKYYRLQHYDEEMNLHLGRLGKMRLE